MLGTTTLLLFILISSLPPYTIQDLTFLDFLGPTSAPPSPAPPPPSQPRLPLPPPPCSLPPRRRQPTRPLPCLVRLAPSGRLSPPRRPSPAARGSFCRDTTHW
ncbi:hypothetical protein QBC44DRAFT_335812 [Cladorrhinum sp. PSN332]|nr:hypothetical protein QBC44DRAFT_335812 [Cladorrhinum sp. PSN332]